MGGRLSIRIPESLQKEIKRLVRKTKKTESQVVREALESYCQRHRKGVSCYDLLVESGLVGCGSGPADLSTNPKYMEGFGSE